MQKKIKHLDIIKETHVNEMVILSYTNTQEKALAYSSVCITAAITARGRIKLHKGLLSTIANGGRILYSDTDSIFAAFKKNVDNEMHGEVFWDTSKENTKITDAVFAITKGYAIKTPYAEITKLRGFKQNSISFEKFKAAFNNESTLYIKEELIQKKNYILFLKLQEKSTLLSNYTKRTFDKNKKTTKPITVGDI